MVRTAATARPEVRDHLAPPTAPPSAPAGPWAVAGALGVVLAASAWVRWLLSDDFSPSPKGPDHIPGWELASIRGMEVVSVLVAAVFVWRLLVRPALRERKLTFDGMLIIAAVTMWFYDPLVNYMNFTFSYNRYFWNFASWTRYIPGWTSPNQHLAPEPLAFIGGGYVWWVCATAFIGCAILRKVRERYPRMSVLRSLAVLYAAIVLLELATEVISIRAGAWSCPGSIRLLRPSAARRYQHRMD